MSLNEIFFIDDDQDFQKIMEVCLQASQDTRARFFTDPREALATVESPDLIVVDHVMPEMSGVDFLRRRQETKDNFQASIILSANKIKLTKELKDLGVIGVIEKPIGPKSFMKKLMAIWNERQIQLAIKAYQDKRLVAIPTETVYGLSAPIDQKDLIGKIFQLKERPFFDPLICHVYNKEQAKRYCRAWPKDADLLCDHFWPGPLTIVVPKKNEVFDMITSGLDTVALRSPNHKLTLELLKKIQVPLAAPSANKFTKTSPTKPTHVLSYFSKEDVFILDGGACDIGIESTIVGWNKDGELSILREGMITSQDIFEKTGIRALVKKEGELEQSTPGAHLVHYQPPYPLYYGSLDLKDFLEQKKMALKPEQFEVIFLSPEPELVARELYSFFLRDLKPSLKARYFRLPKEAQDNEKWNAIINRLKKASSHD